MKFSYDLAIYDYDDYFRRVQNPLKRLDFYVLIVVLFIPLYIPYKLCSTLIFLLQRKKDGRTKISSGENESEKFEQKRHISSNNNTKSCINKESRDSNKDK